MKTHELIKQLQEADPSGELDVCVENIDILFVDLEPAYYDGLQQVLIRDKNKPHFNIVGAKVKRNGQKVTIHTLSIEDLFLDVPNAKIDLKELPARHKEDYKRRIEMWRKEAKEA